MADRSILRRIVAVFDRSAAKKAESEMAESLGKAGSEGGKKAGQGYLRDLRREFDKKKADLQVALAKGTISEKEFRKETAKAAATFRAGILKLMDEAKAKGKEGEAEYIKLSRALKRVGDEGQRHIGGRLVDALKKAAAAAAALFGIRQIIRFGRESIRAAEALQATQRGLEQQLQNTGVAWRDVEAEVRAHARALWDTHRLTQGEVMDILRQLIVVTGDYATSLRAVGLVQDLVKATGLNAERAARLLGRAMNGDINVFNRYGVTLDGTRDILEQLEERFEGAAKAGTTAGEALSKAWTDFKEAFGAALLDVGEGESVLDGVTRAVRWMADNVDELLATIKALTIAIGVLIGVKGLAGMAMAFRTATAAAVTLKTTLKGFYVMIGPKGWFILGVAALTEAIRRKGAAARQAARDMKEWEDSLRSMSIAELEAELRKVAEQRRQVQDELEKYTREGNKRLAADAERRLEIIRQGGIRIINEINRQRAQIDRPAPGGGPDAPGGPGAPGRPEGIDREAEALARLEAQREALIAQMSRDIEVQGRRAEAIRQGEEAVEALNRQLHIEEAVLRSGAEAGSEFEETIRQLAAAQYDAAEAARLAAQDVESAWADALEAVEEARTSMLSFADVFFLIRQEAAGTGAFVANMFRGMAAAALGSLGKFAGQKAIENFALAADEKTKAAIAAAATFTQPWRAAEVAAHLAASKAATVMGAKWAILAGGAAAGGGAIGGLGGGRGGGGGGPGLSGPNTGPAGRAEPLPPEININLIGPGWNALNPDVQSVVFGAMQEAQNRFGQGAKINVQRQR